MSDLDERLEEGWRGLSLDQLRKNVEKTRQDIMERKAVLAFAEVNLAAGERVLRERSK